MADRIGISVPTDVTKNSFFQIHFRIRFGISSRLRSSVTNLFWFKINNLQIINFTSMNFFLVLFLSKSLKIRDEDFWDTWTRIRKKREWNWKKEYIYFVHSKFRFWNLDQTPGFGSRPFWDFILWIQKLNKNICFWFFSVFSLFYFVLSILTIL